MNKDQAQGTIKNIAGKVQEEVGKIVGSQSQQAKGIQKQAEGKAEKRTGDVKHIVAEAVVLANEINAEPKV